MIDRPAEDYVLARVTMQERLASLTMQQRRAVVLRMAGYSTAAIGRAVGTSQPNQLYHWNKALRRISDEII